MADVPVNPASPDHPEAAEAQDSPLEAPAAETEVAAEAVEPPVPAEASAPEATPRQEVPGHDTPPASEPEPSAPESEPELEPVAAAAPAPSAPPPLAAPSIAATLEAPPVAAGTGGSASEEGGEWDLLVGKVRAFLDGGELQAWWDRLGGPLRGLGLLIGLVLVLRLYDALLDTLDDLPLVPRLLQLAGLIALVRFALTRLVRTEERQAVLSDWKARWQRFRG
ncbi:hypothetical protein NZK33_12530 [Cyanobium sp. FGCU-6]|nr:hypothetical protein [Cyanobium sp. FGCU6]